MRSYFFIPANRLHKLKQIKELNVHDVIIDLEDAIKVSEISRLLEELTTDKKYIECFIRLSIHDDNLELDVENFHRLSRHGYTRFVLPKFQNKNQLQQFFKLIDDHPFQFIILVETPKTLIQLEDILEEFSSKIFAVGIGSHDLLSYVGAKHTMNNLEYVRQSLLYTTKAYDLEAIDFASMNITDEQEFSFELKDSFEKGYDSKFFIHPWQIHCLNKVNFYSKEELKWAESVYDELKKLNFNNKEFDVLKIGGQAVEKPHINRAKKIIEYFKNKA